MFTNSMAIEYETYVLRITERYTVGVANRTACEGIQYNIFIVFHCKCEEALEIDFMRDNCILQYF